MSKTKTELKPCPFCGGVPEVMYNCGKFSVACTVCKCGTSYEHDFKGQAFAAWNRRPSDGHTCGECANFCAGKWCGCIRECVDEHDNACSGFELKTERSGK